MSHAPLYKVYRPITDSLKTDLALMEYDDLGQLFDEQMYEKKLKRLILNCQDNSTV